MPNPAVFKVVAEVVDECPLGYRQGQEFEFIGLQTPEHGFCGGAYHAIFPMLVALNNGVNFPWENEAGVVHTTCPDRGKVSFKTTRVGYLKDLRPEEFARLYGQPT
jgi:uncharacterized repeat protein (TIGR04076 family)